MSQCGKSAQEFIQNSFSPLVAVIRSPQIDQIIGRNNLTFVELLQPFCNLSSEGQIRDPSGTQCSVKNWKLVIRDVNWKPPPPVEARKLLNHSVSANNCEQTISLEIGRYKIDIPEWTPWIDSWCEKYVEVQFASEHEFTKHFVSCMLVGSTSDGDVTDTFKSLVQQMAQLQTVTPPRLPRWFNSNVLRSYVLVHDISTGNRDKAERSFESLKQTYGAGNCFFLCLNSRSPSDPDPEHVITDPWSGFISRKYDSSNDISSQNNIPRTPVDARTMSNIVTDMPEEQNTALQIPCDAAHPLSPLEESETGFDNANTLQNTLSGSTESVMSHMTSSAWDTASAGAPPAVRGAALSAQDLEAVRQFVEDFAFKALLQYFERQIAALHEAVANRKGVSRSLLSATKRWFGTSKPGTNTNINTVVYTPDCPELQLRRLGDLWFMCGQWARAYDAYHTAKREFHADGAWLCYAGALEMAALSAFMADEPTRKTYAYMEESITTYLNTCRMAPYAVRATILSAQCLTARGLSGEAAAQLIRLTAEDSDLRSAVLLEQAARCFASPPRARRLLPRMPRKYAFHMVLAANRYSKAGLRQHAYRCYKQAFQVYEGSEWRLAVDQVRLALGRLAAALRRGNEAVAWLAAPLGPGSAHLPPQQQALLREFMLAHEQWVPKSDTRKYSPLPLPLLRSQSTRVLLGGIAPLSAPGRVGASGTSLADPDSAAYDDDRKYWHKMETMLLQRVQGGVPLVFKPNVTLYTDDTDNTSNPTVPKGEPIHMSIELENPLKIPLNLTDVHLLWRFESQGETITNEEDDNTSHVISGQAISCVSLAPQSVHALSLSLTPLQAGLLVVYGVAYNLCNSVEGSAESAGGTVIAGKQLLAPRGPRLRRSKDAPAPEYAADRRLEIRVADSAPCLQMTFSELSPWVVSGELVSVEVELVNAGPAEMANLHLAVSHPQCMRVVTQHNADQEFKQLYQTKYEEVSPNIEERTLRTLRWRSTCARHVTAAPRPPARLTLLLRPTAAAPRLRLLAYYEAAGAEATAGAGAGYNPTAQPRPYRLLRHTFSLQVMDSIKVVAVPRRNIKLNADEGASETLTLAVEVKNVNSAGGATSLQPVELLDASLLSRHWRLTECVAPHTAAEPLASHEKLHLVLKGCRDSARPQAVLHSGIKINPKHQEALALINSRPYSEFVMDYPSPWDDDFDARGQGKKRAEALIESTLVVRWKTAAGGRSVVGQHHLWLSCFLSEPESETAPRLFGREVAPAPAGGRALQHALLCRLEHAQSVEHDFAESKLCLVPVRLHLVNCCAAPVTAHVDWPTNAGGGGGVGWAGAASGVRVRVGELSATSVRVCAAVSAPGSYQLAPGRVAAAPAASASSVDPVPQHCIATSLLVVKQAC